MPEINIPGIRVRFAPSPTGYLHVGGARTALFNYLFARSSGGTFILRIEDTDKERSSSLATDQVIESLKWLGLTWDEGPECGGQYGPYFQSERLGIYREYAGKLIGNKSAYYCFCPVDSSDSGCRCSSLNASETAAKINSGNTFVIRFKNPCRLVEFNDAVRGKIQMETGNLGDFILIKSDGYPSYNFAVVVDDALMHITHIFRGDDHISNTPRQILLYEAMGFSLPVFGHISMILGSNKEKLSKRHGATSVLDFKKDGYLHTALINQLALLGWSPPDGNEVMTMEDLCRSFHNPRFNSAPAVFDYGKLEFLNRMHLSKMPNAEFITCILPFLKETAYYNKINSFDTNEVVNIQILDQIRARISLLVHAPREFDVFFRSEIAYEKNILENLQKTGKIREFVDICLKIISVHADTFLSSREFEQIRSECAACDMKGKKFFISLRAVLTGTEHGIDTEFLWTHLERKTAFSRFDKFRQFV